MKIKHVRMTVIPNQGATTVHEITEAEAISIKDNVFCRPGKVSIEGIPNGYLITDVNGQTMLTAVFEDQEAKSE